MTTGVQIVWWIGLIGALLITLVILREVELTLHSLRDIHKLSIFTRQAAQGIGRNVQVIPDLANVAGPAQNIDQGSAQLAETAHSIESKLAGLLPGLKEEGGEK